MSESKQQWIFTCTRCYVELFRCKELIEKTINRNLCLICFSILDAKARAYDEDEELCDERR